MIREYRTGHTFSRSIHSTGISGMPYRVNDAWVWAWRITVDLRHVTSAQPTGSDELTIISVNGRPEPFVINEDYERFVRDWRTAKP